MPAYKTLKYRQLGQGGSTELDASGRDLRAELLAAEATHFGKGKDKGMNKGGQALIGGLDSGIEEGARDSIKRIAEDAHAEEPEQKRLRILEATKDIDADASDDDDAEDNSDEDDDDDEDETAELMRELEKIKRERAADKEKADRAAAEAEQSKHEEDIAFGNPLLNPQKDFSVKRRYFVLFILPILY